MSLPQQKMREIVFEMLYSYDIAKSSDDDMLPLLMEELSVPRTAVRAAQERVHLLRDSMDEIDTLISKTSVSYAFERIHTVERNVLRLGIFEMLYDDAIPPKVAIAEAIRLAKKFGAPESLAFINAILDNIYKTSQGIAPQEISSTIDDMLKTEELTKQAIEQMPLEKNPEEI